MYGLFIGMAIVVGWSVAEKIEPKVNKVAPLVLILGFVGARIYHVVDMWEFYSQNLALIVAVWQGGMSIWGGLLGGIVGYTVYSIRYTVYKIDWSILGAMATAMPLAQAIGRIGNGVNGEFVNKVGIMPWWGAEAILDLMLFVLLRGRTSKWRVGIYLLGYGLIRLVLQPYRL